MYNIFLCLQFNLFGTLSLHGSAGLMEFCWKQQHLNFPCSFVGGFILVEQAVRFSGFCVHQCNLEVFFSCFDERAIFKGTCEVLFEGATGQAFEFHNSHEDCLSISSPELRGHISVVTHANSIF